MILALLIALGVVVALLGLLVAGLLRSHAEILGRLHELGVGLESPPGGSPPQEVTLERRPAAQDGARAHDIVGETPRGEVAAFGVVGAQHDTLLAFLSSGCLTCAGFWQAFQDPAELQLPPRTRLLVVTKSADAESVSTIAGLAPRDLPVVMSTSAWEGYEVPGAPYFILVDGSGGRVTGEGTASRWDQVQSLLAQATSDAAAHRERARPWGDPDNPQRIDAELLDAGVGPGHPSLYPEREPTLDDGPRP